MMTQMKNIAIEKDKKISQLKEQLNIAISTLELYARWEVFPISSLQEQLVDIKRPAQETLLNLYGKEG